MKPEYPHPKKGEKVKCIACKDGWVYNRVKGRRPCKACNGQGYIKAN